VTAMYSFVAEEKANPGSVWSTVEMCRVLAVSRQGFYDWEGSAPVAASGHRPAARSRDRGDLGMFSTQLRVAEGAPVAGPQRVCGVA